MNVNLLAAILGTLGVAALLAWVLAPARRRSYIAAVAPQDRAAAVTFGRHTIYDLSSRRREQDDTEVEQLLRAANWFWAPGEPTAPLSAPFYSVAGYHATSLAMALYWGVGGLALGTLLALNDGSPSGWLALFLAPLAAAWGYFQPGSRLRAAGAERQHNLTVEMAFRLPELAALVSTGKSISQAFRTLTARPGGPFVTEVARYLRIYDATSSVEAAANAVIAQNRFLPLTEFFRAVLLVEQQGGAMAPTLNIQADLAQATLQRRLREQADKNAKEMNGPALVGALLATLVLVGGPAIAMLLSSL